MEEVSEECKRSVSLEETRMICKDCIYWAPWGKRDEAEFGNCRRHAPSIVSALIDDADDDAVEKLYYATRFPITDPEQTGCGEGKEP